MADIYIKPTPASIGAATAAQGAKADAALPASAYTAADVRAKIGADPVASRAAMLLGSASTYAYTAFATAAQGTLADNAVPITRTVAGKPLSSDVTIAKADVGLSNVDNTSDASKPVSTAQAAALSLKLDKTANLSDLANAATARGNLGLGTAATTAATAYATAAQGAKADAALPASAYTAADVRAKIGADPVASRTAIGAAAAAQGAKADSALQPTMIGTFTGGGSYLFTDINEREVNLLMFAPSLTNGANVSVALQAMMTAAALTGKPARIPVHPLGFSWTMTAGVNVPGVAVLCDPTAKIFTSADIDMFVATGHSCLWDGGAITHDGDGRFFDSGAFSSHNIRHVGLTAGDTGATTELIRMLGSNIFVDDNEFTTFRVNAYCINVSKQSGTININSRISNNYFGGTGKGWLIQSEHVGERPEGLTIESNKCILTGTTHVEIQEILSLKMINNMFDLSSGATILLNSEGLGIDNVEISSSYITAASNPTGVSGGVAIKSQGSVAITGLKILHNEIRHSAYGCALSDNLSEVKIKDNTFTNIDQVAIGGQADNWDMQGNTFNTVGTNVSITEGAGGGSIIIKDEVYSSSAAATLTIATAARWSIGQTFGKVLKSRRSNSTAASPESGVYLDVAHGLAAAPRRETISVEASFSSGAYTNIIANIAAIDETNVTVQLFFTTVINGVIMVVVDCSI